MTPVRSIFFDIGDTLVFDDPPLRVRFGAALLAAGISHSPKRLPAAFRVGEDYALAQHLHGVGWDETEVMRGSTEHILRALELSPLCDAQWRVMLKAFLGMSYVRRVHPQAVPLLQELRRRGFILGAISDWEETLPDVLADLGLAPFFDVLAVSALVGVTKPATGLFQYALCAAGAEPAASLHVGDWHALDIAGARAAGMQTLLFDHAGRTPDADCPCVQTFDALRAYLLALPVP